MEMKQIWQILIIVEQSGVYRFSLYFQYFWLFNISHQLSVVVVVAVIVIIIIIVVIIGGREVNVEVLWLIPKSANSPLEEDTYEDITNAIIFSKFF